MSVWPFCQRLIFPFTIVAYLKFNKNETLHSKTCFRMHESLLWLAVISFPVKWQRRRRMPNSRIPHEHIQNSSPSVHFGVCVCVRRRLNETVTFWHWPMLAGMLHRSVWLCSWESIQQLEECANRIARPNSLASNENGIYRHLDKDIFFERNECVRPFEFIVDGSGRFQSYLHLFFIRFSE